VQEELFHTFNELSSQNKQIVLTSDRPPKEIATLEERLRTRFEGGMIADIQPPTTETKIAILKRKAMDRKCSMPDEVLAFLAQDSGHDVRTLEGRLTKVIFASKLHEEPITLELATRALNESVSEASEQEDVTPEKIIAAVCSYFKQKKEDLLGKGKKADLAKARQICAYLMCEMLSLPLVSIGNILGGRDHTTIMYARDKMENLMNTSTKTAKEVDDIKSILLKQ
jgi:chromosomal replication initiator protein